jgi:hypothetical protein
MSIVGLIVDAHLEPVAVWNHYRSAPWDSVFASTRGESEWSEATTLINNAQSTAVAADHNSSMHMTVIAWTENDGLSWAYARNRDGTVTTFPLYGARPPEIVVGRAWAAADIAVDALQRAHIVYLAAGNNDEIQLWYVVSPEG